MWSMGQRRRQHNKSNQQLGCGFKALARERRHFRGEVGSEEGLRVAEVVELTSVTVHFKRF